MLFLPGFYQAIGKQSCVKKVLVDSYWQIFKRFFWQLVVVKLDIQVQGYIFYFV